MKIQVNSFGFIYSFGVIMKKICSYQNDFLWQISYKDSPLLKINSFKHIIQKIQPQKFIAFTF